ncbi:MAG: LytR family transcriptional regulator, partial [Bulleidia sp.]|nr:LytR family transcriptional regulator [Bulleidia sp.]
RGKNQMKVIKAMIQKMTSTDFLLNYSNVLNALAGSFETSIPMDLISEIVKAQLSDGGDWNIVSYAVSGAGDTQPTWSGGAAYVMWPDESTVETAKALIQQVKDGGILEQQ